jgi:hypothetical protein
MPALAHHDLATKSQQKGMSMIPNVDKFAAVQRKLYDVAHRTPHELKPLGYQILNTGLDPSRNYVDPDFMSLPLHDCEHLRRLSPEQTAVVTAYFFAQLYTHVMNGEIDVIHHNSTAADMCFERASNAWTVLFQESSEEQDHVITFRAVNLGLCGDVGVPPAKAGRYGPLFRWLTDYLAREGKNLRAQTYGGLTLSVRFLANLELKRQELYLHAGAAKETLHEVAVAITDAHRTDEARHTATSWEYGTGFFKECSEGDQAMIRGLLTDRLTEMLDRHYSDRALTEANGNTRCAVHCLGRALKLPAFADFPLTIDQLKESWIARSLSTAHSESYTKSLKWFANQWMRFVDEFKLAPPNPGDASWQRFRQAAAAAA